VIDALVEDVIAANSRRDLLAACKALDRVILARERWLGLFGHSLADDFARSIFASGQNTMLLLTKDLSSRHQS
jgi:hypothetical protein